MNRAHGGWQRRYSMALHREENKVPLRQSPKCRWMIAKDKLGQKIATTKGNVTASWRQRNLRSGWRVRQYELTTSLRQRWRCAISQWIGVILYGFRHRSRSGRSRCVSHAALSYLWKRTPSRAPVFYSEYGFFFKQVFVVILCCCYFYDKVLIRF